MDVDWFWRCSTLRFAEYRDGRKSNVRQPRCEIGIDAVPGWYEDRTEGIFRYGRQFLAALHGLGCHHFQYAVGTELRLLLTFRSVIRMGKSVLQEPDILQLGRGGPE